MNIFEKVKEAVSTMDAASFYGIKVGKNGLCCCPFHDDKNPSMKVDLRYFCFGCGAKGDVIDFVSRLYGLRPYATAKKIAEDFGINCSDCEWEDKTSDNKATDNRDSEDNEDKKQQNTLKEQSSMIKPEMVRRRQEYEVKRAFEQERLDALFSLHEYRDKLRSYKRDYAPTTYDELDTCNPLFEEAIKSIDKIEWMIDQLTFGYRDEQLTFINEYKGEIENVRNRNKELG